MKCANYERDYSDFDDRAGSARALDQAKRRLRQLQSLNPQHPEKDDEAIEALERYISENED